MRRDGPNAVFGLLVTILATGAFIGGVAPTGQHPRPVAGPPAVRPALADGERIFRQGLLPSGEPMRAVTPGGVPMPGMTFACAGCHTRSGLGTMDEGLRIPPINAVALFQPLYPYFPTLSESERAELLPLRFQTPPRRPAYTETTLASAIRTGVDPTGRSLNSVMPRYVLSDADMACLVAYLRQLSSRTSPGVTDTTISLATVITDEVASADRDAMLGVIDESIARHNNLGGGHMASMVSMQVMALAFRHLTVARWLLHGPPGTWRAQLEKHYAAQPVFAMVGGLSNTRWAPIHQFCEDHQLPCVLPITDLPERSTTDYYTLYFSRGYYEEGEAVARHIVRTADSAQPRTVVQVVGAGTEAQALAAGFRDAWVEAGGNPIRTVEVGRQQPLTAQWLARLCSGGPGSTLVLWTTPEVYPALRSLAGSASRPASVFLSSSLLAGSLWDLPSDARPFTFVSYPYREPGPRSIPARMGGARRTVDRDYRQNDRRIPSRTETAMAILIDALTRMERNFYRDHLLDLIDMQAPQAHSDYELLNFAPGQRYLSEGSFIMRLSEGPNPALIRVSAVDRH